MKEQVQKLMNELAAWQVREQPRLPVNVQVAMAEVHRELNRDPRRELTNGMHLRRQHKHT